ncbi:hypothetical protein H5410_036961 [Solanum commersonii]|uniref:Uncharacterized protein n=1 Tax=Solanum commersonii TaxID=4109 RepID=A0A9J5Y5S9_SOLCO|nr:hypothetical protein H5410_036961 [Solanum commersonii]
MIDKELIAHTAIWLTIFAANMVLRVNIDQIEPATRDWICKVQIVEITRPRESLDKKCTFQNFILEDEEECQIKAVMYADEIEQYADKLKLLHTYLISTTKILDKETVIEQIKPSHEVEKALPPPTKLNITSFDRIPHLMVDSTAKIDILAIVLRCGTQKNAGRSHHRCREITLCDNQKNQFLFTLWEDFREIEGHEIASKMATEADLLVILGRSIGISTYQGLSLQTRAKENKTMLLTCPSQKTSTSSSIAPMIVTTAGQQLISIAEISSAPSVSHTLISSFDNILIHFLILKLCLNNQNFPQMRVFYVEAEMAVLDEFQDFLRLNARDANVRSGQRIERILNVQNAIGKCTFTFTIHIFQTCLHFSCSFQIDLIDNTATTTASISAELGEKLLSMTAEDIFDITCTKRQSLSLNHVQEMLSNKVFEIQLRKSSWGSSNTTHATLSILSYMEKQHLPQATTDRTSKKIKPLEISEVEVLATTTAAGSSNAPPKFEPPTPTKKV